jgi:hypothetical protein
MIQDTLIITLCYCALLNQNLFCFKDVHRLQRLNFKRCKYNRRIALGQPEGQLYSLMKRHTNIFSLILKKYSQPISFLDKIIDFSVIFLFYFSLKDRKCFHICFQILIINISWAEKGKWFFFLQKFTYLRLYKIPCMHIFKVACLQIHAYFHEN